MGRWRMQTSAQFEPQSHRSLQKCKLSRKSLHTENIRGLYWKKQLKILQNDLSSYSFFTYFCKCGKKDSKEVKARVVQGSECTELGLSLHKAEIYEEKQS